MCRHCNYEKMLLAADLQANENRMGVLEVVGNNPFPLSADQIFTTLERSRSINRVTVYRILDLLVEKGIVERLATGGRAAYYGLAPNEHHRPHAHFYCKRCGRMDCLSPDSLNVDSGAFWKTFPGRIDKVEVRVDGICQHCVRQQEEEQKAV